MVYSDQNLHVSYRIVLGFLMNLVLPWGIYFSFWCWHYKAGDTWHRQHDDLCKIQLGLEMYLPWLMHKLPFVSWRTLWHLRLICENRLNRIWASLINLHHYRWFLYFALLSRSAMKKVFPFCPLVSLTRHSFPKCPRKIRRLYFDFITVYVLSTFPDCL